MSQTAETEGNMVALQKDHRDDLQTHNWLAPKAESDVTFGYSSCDNRKCTDVQPEKITWYFDAPNHFRAFHVTNSPKLKSTAEEFTVTNNIRKEEILDKQQHCAPKVTKLAQDSHSRNYGQNFGSSRVKSTRTMLHEEDAKLSDFTVNKQQCFHVAFFGRRLFPLIQ